MESTDPASFQAEVDHWSVKNNLTSNLITTICSGATVPLLGGPGVLSTSGGSFKRSYTITEPHQSIIVVGEVWFIDAWTYDDFLLVIIWDEDVVTFSEQILVTQYNQAYWTAINSCGNPSSKDLPGNRFVITTPHSGNLTIQFITSSFNIHDGAIFGIRDLKILISDKTQSKEQESYSDASTFPGWHYCPFDKLYLTDGVTNSCGDCNPECLMCKKNDPAFCNVCTANYIYNGTDCVLCDTTCVDCFKTGANGCLTCLPLEYLYSNNSCINHCDPPFQTRTQNGVDYCDFPCNSDFYLFPNLTCGSECPLPFVPRTVNTDNFCEYSACPLTHFFYPDGSCQATCDPPMRIQPVAELSFCQPPCDNSSLFYDIIHQSCNATCNYPYYSNSTPYYTYCYYVQPQPTSSSMDSLAPVLSTIAMIVSLILVGQTWGIVVFALSRMLNYIKFIDIYYYAETFTMRETWKLRYVNMNLDIKIPANVYMKLPLRTINPIFSLIFFIPTLSLTFGLN